MTLECAKTSLQAAVADLLHLRVGQLQVIDVVRDAASHNVTPGVARDVTDRPLVDDASRRHVGEGVEELPHPGVADDQETRPCDEILKQKMDYFRICQHQGPNLMVNHKFLFWTS